MSYINHVTGLGSAIIWLAPPESWRSKLGLSEHMAIGVREASATPLFQPEVVAIVTFDLLPSL